jgi:two-component system cell cycle sensor histidine kinase/response regulator CckA
MPRSTHSKSSVTRQANAQTQKVLQIARKVAATIGTDFFCATAKHIAGAVAADCVLIGEFVGGQTERVRTLGAWLDGCEANLEFELAGSASEALLFGRPVQYRADAQVQFPTDGLLTEVGAQALLGVPLLDQRGLSIGLMVALYRHSIVRLSVPRHLLQIFSGRAAAELSRKRKEDELIESDQRYRAFIARSADAMWRVEFEKPIDTTLSAPDQLSAMYRYGYVAECNDALAVMLGLEKAEQVIGSRLEDVAPLSNSRVKEFNLNAIRHGYDPTTLELTFVDSHGQSRHVLRSQWGIVEDGLLVRVWGTTRDITDLKLSEEALDASETRMARLLESMKLIVVIEDTSGAITYCNRHFYHRTGWKAAAVKGKSILELLTPPEERGKLQAIFEDARSKSDSPVHFESTLLGPEGQRWQFDWDRTILRGAGDQSLAWASVGRDVTDNKALEAQLRQTRKLATIGQLAGGVAHDFNNLLTVILGYSSSLLENEKQMDPELSTALDQIRQAASKGADLTQRLLAFGRRQVLRPEFVSLNVLISDTTLMLRTVLGDAIHLVTNLDPSLGLARIDPSSFHQVLMNLALNARDAMPSGGTFTIATANTTISESKTGELPPPGELVEVTISDSGTGMTDEVREHLFEPFFTTKDQGKGTGLGLSTVYGIIQQSGGSVLVETAPQQGATFRLYFPRVSAGAQPAKKKDKTAVMPRGTETILVVEDRDDVRKLTAKVLHSLGYSVLEADGPARAIEFGLDRGRTIHLVLTDVAMPGMNGLELAERIRAYHAEIKVLYMSGYADAPRVFEKLTHPDSAFLQKPFTPHALAAKLRELLDAP